jgi:hypothetical protein
VLDARQQVVAASLPASHGLRYPQPAVVQIASSGTQRATLDVFTPAQLAALSPLLQARSHIELLATPGARPSRRNVSDNGLLLHAAAKVPGQPLVLVGGVLLNRNIEFIDRIRHLVYPQGSLPIRSAARPRCPRRHPHRHHGDLPPAGAPSAAACRRRCRNRCWAVVGMAEQAR